MESDPAPLNASLTRSATSVGGNPEMSATYTIPGILLFIKHEWSRFEKERANWEVERAELQAKIAFLQGERKGHESLVRDLVRRIKMLEYALKHERAKLYKLQHGKELVFKDAKQVEPANSNPALELSTVASQKEDSRKILRDYLQELGFPENVLEARINRVGTYRSLHTHSSPEPAMSQGDSPKAPPSVTALPPTFPSPPPLPNGPIANGTDTEPQLPNKRETSPPRPAVQPKGDVMGEKEPEEGALAAFNFLRDEEDDDSDEEDEEEGGEGGWEAQPLVTEDMLQGLEPSGRLNEDPSVLLDDEALTEDAMDEWTAQYPLVSEGSPSIQEPMAADEHGTDWKVEFSREVQKYAQQKAKMKKDKVLARPSKKELQRMEQFKNEAEDQPPSSQSPNQPLNALGGLGMGSRLPGRGRKLDSNALVMAPGRGVSDERIEVSMLGELAGLSISNESEGGFQVPATETVKKWEDKYTLRSHFDTVTSVAFHTSEHVLVTGSEDCTLKIWNVQRSPSAKKASSILVDVEPVHTLRGHRGAVLCVAMGNSGNVCFSGGVDSTIRVWQLPTDFSDPYGVYDHSVHQGVLQGHTDAVWCLAVHPTSGNVLSCAADGSCRLWNHQLASPQLKVFQAESAIGVPTSVDFLGGCDHQMVASYSAARCVVYDLETGQAVVNLDSASTYDGTPHTQINKVVSHPTLPVVVTGHEDKYIRFYDANSGQVVHSMTAHTDAVTGLAVDPHGLYLLSGSHDGSLRFWNMDTKICLQEISAHRQRFDESICNVACHKSKSYFASAGADGIAKVFI